MKLLITDLRRTKKGRYSVYIQEEFAGVLHEDVFYTFPYKVNEEIDSQELTEYLYQSQIVIAKERALRYLGARSYTARGLRDKLLKLVDEDAAQQVVERMEELGLIDDRDYARRYAADCVNLRGFSHSRTVQALYQRGIPREIIEETMADRGEEDSEGLIYQMIQKKYTARLGDEVGERRMIAALQRRGFRYEDIRRVLNHMEEDPGYYEEETEE